MRTKKKKHDFERVVTVTPGQTMNTSYSKASEQTLSYLSYVYRTPSSDPWVDHVNYRFQN